MMDFGEIWAHIKDGLGTISDALGVQWAPYNVPMARRLQTLGAVGWISLILLGEPFSISVYKASLLGFGGWAVMYAVTADLDPSKNYLFACFPHGLVCAGAFGAFATNALDFYKIFPGMKCNMMTLGAHFLVPLFRDLILALGGCPASRESILYLLDAKKNKGNCVTLIVGGAAEALDAHPGNVFRPLNNPRDSLLRRFQEKLSLEGTCGVLSSIMMDFGEIWAHIKDGLGTISDALGVQWAPYNVPMARRLQTLGAVGWISLILLGEPFSIYLYIKLLYSDYWWLAVMYATADLDPSKNYLFACFPHGLVCAGAFGAFATNALDFYKIFPGMKCNMMTLGAHFLVPLFRDLILALGGCPASRESILYLLDAKKNKGNCVTLIVGGAAEALDAHPGEYNVILSRRKGFFREWTGVSPIFPIGRGVFQYSYGLVPLRAPVTTVVGAPMEVQRNLDPTDAEVDAVHAQFTKRLVNLFESEKYKYLKDAEKVHLVIT
ncbi:hypothetical protein MSG28_003030 [Choristoneura fumiferana]|nr:hypothetical protein MSG28_003030 [Choristoneura fumiferana]